MSNRYFNYYCSYSHYWEHYRQHLILLTNFIPQIISGCFVSYLIRSSNNPVCFPILAKLFVQLNLVSFISFVFVITINSIDFYLVQIQLTILRVGLFLVKSEFLKFCNCKKGFCQLNRHYIQVFRHQATILIFYRSISAIVYHIHCHRKI